MTSHPSSAVSVTSVLTATSVLVLGYHFGRTHAAWRDVRSAKRSVADQRKTAWGRTFRLIGGAIAILATLAAAAYDAAH